MSRRSVALLLLLAGSEAVGLGTGQWFLLMLQWNVPPPVLQEYGLARAHFVFLGCGALLGVVIFSWALLACLVTRILGPSLPSPDPGDLPRR